MNEKRPVSRKGKTAEGKLRLIIIGKPSAYVL